MWLSACRLSEAETLVCDSKVLSRYESNRLHGIKDLVPADKSLDYDLLGSRGELAASKMTGLPWTGDSMDRKRKDLDDLIEVKTVYPERGLLVQSHQLVRLDPYLLVYSSHPSYRLVGWAFGFEVERHPSRLPPRTGSANPYLMPAEKLYSVDSLQNWYRSKRGGER